LLEKELLAGKIEKIAGQENVKLDEPMKNHTSFKVGGPADILVTPVSVSQLSQILKIMQKQKRSGVCYGQRNKLDCKR